jgi:hypothetical protein
MRFRRIRLRKEYRLKAWTFIIFSFSSCFIFIPQPNRALMLTYFTKKCINYQQVYSKKLNDRVVDYSVLARLTGTEKSEDLGKKNINVSDLSPHLYGNAFDSSYARFSIRKYSITQCDRWYMKEALAEVIYRLREEKKCWATYERRQGCFHVVAR